MSDLFTKCLDGFDPEKAEFNEASEKEALKAMEAESASVAEKEVFSRTLEKEVKEYVLNRERVKEALMKSFFTETYLKKRVDAAAEKVSTQNISSLPMCSEPIS